MKLRHIVAALALTALGSPAFAAITMGACGVVTICDNATSCSLPPPAGITNGNLLVAFAFAQETSLAGDTFSVTGFTSRGQQIGSASFDRAWLVATKTASGESGNYTLTSSLATALYDWRGAVCIVTGADTTTPMDAAAVNGTETTNTGVFDPAAITTVTNGAVVLSIVAANDGAPAGTLTQPSGYTSYVNGSASSRTLGVAYLTKATAGAEDPGNWTGFNATNEISGGTLALRPNVAPTFAAGPTNTSCTTTTCTIGFTASKSATAYIASYTTGASAPADCAAIAAHSGAAASDSKAVTGADSFTLASVMLEHDYYVCLNDGTTATATNDGDVLNVVRSIPSGYTRVVNAGLSATSLFTAVSDTTGDVTSGSAEVAGMTDTSRFDPGALVTVSSGFPAGVLKVVSKTPTSITVDRSATSSPSNVTTTGHVDRAGGAWFNPAIATSDQFELQSATSVMSSTATWATDLDVEFAGVGSTFASFNFCVQDVSDGTGEFTTPACWTDPTEGVGYLNNVPPVIDFNQPVLEPITIVVLRKDQAMTSIDLGAYCSHAFGLTSRIFLRSGSLPTGVVLTVASLGGIPTVENETGVAIEWWCEAGKSKLFDSRGQILYVTDGVIPVPLLTDSDIVDAYVDMNAARPFVESTDQLTVNYICSMGADEDEIVAQTPAFGGNMNDVDPVEIDVHRQSLCPGDGSASGGIQIGIDLNL